ncbi:MAG: hypothetical protein ABIG68_00990, partial [Acidobacteriota bacterium]
MKKSRLLFIVAALSLSLLFLGCASRPDELIQQTEQAREQAIATYADQFALEDWSAAEKDWSQAEDALQKEDYGKAYTALLSAKSRYTKARDIAGGKREETVRKIEGLKSAGSIRCKNLLEAGAKLPASRKKDLEARCQDFESQLATIDTHIQNGEFSDAEFKAGKILRAV